MRTRRTIDSDPWDSVHLADAKIEAALDLRLGPKSPDNEGLYK